MLIANPNLAIDRTLRLEELRPGNVQRPERAVVSLGGKGVNVARTARAFGRRAPVVGFTGREDAERVQRLAEAEGAELAAVVIEGATRVASILLEAHGRVTVLNEPGPDVDDAGWSALEALLAARLGGHHVLCCSGSLPPGPADGDARLVRLARSAGRTCIVDTAGAALAAALAVEPDLVTPNLAEAEALLVGTRGEGVEPSGEDVVARALAAVEGLVERGARQAVVTVGRHGVAFGDGGTVTHRAAPEVSVASPIGAGDAFVGGLALALEAGVAELNELVGFATAVAAASCETAVAGRVVPSRVVELCNELAVAVPAGLDEGALA